MTPTAVHTRLAVTATAMVLALAGCGHTSVPQETNSATTAVTDIDPNRGVYNRLKEIEERRPDQIPKTARTDYPGAFDPDTGRLLPYRDAYARAQEQGCPDSCVWGGYSAMVEQARRTADDRPCRWLYQNTFVSGLETRCGAVVLIIDGQLDPAKVPDEGNRARNTLAMWFENTANPGSYGLDMGEWSRQITLGKEKGDWSY